MRIAISPAAREFIARKGGDITLTIITVGG
jgi:hypothetical protein